jgi:hypothetical protein
MTRVGEFHFCRQIAAALTFSEAPMTDMAEEDLLKTAIDDCALSPVGRGVI